MKNLLKIIGILTLLVGLFSCETASIMKRHYNKGYYVSKKHKPSQPDPRNIVTPEKAPAIEPAVIEKIAQSSPDKTEVGEKTAQISNKDEPVAKHKKIRNIFKDESPVSYSFAPERIMKHPFDARKNLKDAIAQDDVARDALSLLWILILVLLIVYVAGLIFDLFGLGPVFHILGVIVLVLLILWLLRII